MSVSLCTQTVLCCLIIQVLNIKSHFLHVSLTSVHSNLEHGLAILKESFSPLRSVLHNLLVEVQSRSDAVNHAIPILSCTLQLDPIDLNWF